MKLFGSRPHQWTRALIGAIAGSFTGPWWLFGQHSLWAGAVAFVISGAIGGYLGRRIGQNLGDLTADRDWRDWAKEGMMIGAVTGLAVGALGGALCAILITNDVGSVEAWFFQILELMLQAWVPAVAGGVLLGGLTGAGVGRLYHQRYFDVTILNEPDPMLEEGNAAATVNDNVTLEETIIIEIPND